jgi:hypothetical protein
VRLASAAAADAGLAQKLAAPRGPRPHNKNLGCGTLLVSSLIALSAGAVVGALLMVLNARVETTSGGSVQETGIFSAILVFMAVFVAVYAVFVWRQARANAVLNAQVGRWLGAKERYARLRYCARCDGVFLPGQQRLVPVEQAQAFLYERERPTPSGETQAQGAGG